MKIPVVLPLVEVKVAPDGTLAVDLDRIPYAAERCLTGHDLTSVVDEITSTLASPVRVELTKPDGSMLVDIATPPRDPIPEPKSAAAEPQQARSHGTGFRPGERIAVAYVVMHQVADADGAASIELPPALLGRAGLAMLLYGLDSQVAIEMRA